MKKMMSLYVMLICILINSIGCGNARNKEENTEPNQKEVLIPVNSVQGFTSMNGFKAEDGKFYFTGIQNNRWGFYELDLNTHAIEEVYGKIGEYDVFIPIEKYGAIYVDVDGNLYIRQDGKDRKIDEEIYGTYSPNLLVSPDGKGILYTKGKQENASLYRYLIGEASPIRIKEKISPDAFFTFSYTTHWSNQSHYFIFNNKEIYDEAGKLYATINGTAAKWAPNDGRVAFIKEPKDLEKNQIFVGDWKSYIGTQFYLFDLKQKKEKVVYENQNGIIDAIDNIQWAKDGSLVGLSVGEIQRTSNGALESIDYEKVFVHRIKDGWGKEIHKVPYNFYEILFDTHIYGSSIGKRDQVEIVEISSDARKVFDQPVILNARDMFIISSKDRGYLANGRALIEIDKEGRERKILELPWDINEMYLDHDSKKIIITNKEYLLFVINL